MSNLIHVSIALAFAVTSACGVAQGDGPEEGASRDAASVTAGFTPHPGSATEALPILWIVGATPSLL